MVGRRPAARSVLGDARRDAAPRLHVARARGDGERVSVIALERLEKPYADGTRAVCGIDFSADEGELIVLLGPSGCGKTTTLRMIAGLELATGGAIRLRERDVTALRPSERDIGMVFQFYALYP